MSRIDAHPILKIEEAPVITFYYNNAPLQAKQGDTIAAALLSCGIRVFRKTAKNGSPRGVYCGIGQCTDCVVVVNGEPNIRSCVTLVEENMRVEQQQGLGR